MNALIIPIKQVNKIEIKVIAIMVIENVEEGYSKWLKIWEHLEIRIVPKREGTNYIAKDP